MVTEVKWSELIKGDEVVLKFRDDSELKAVVVFVNYQRFLTVDFEGSKYLKTVDYCHNFLPRVTSFLPPNAKIFTTLCQSVYQHVKIAIYPC